MFCKTGTSRHRALPPTSSRALYLLPYLLVTTCSLKSFPSARTDAHGGWDGQTPVVGAKPGLVLDVACGPCAVTKRSRPGGNAVHYFVKNLRQTTGNHDERAKRARLAAGRTQQAGQVERRNISWRSRPMPKKFPRSALIRRTCSTSGTGWADVIQWTRPSAFRRCSRLARTISARCSPAFTKWTNISAPRRLKGTCRC